MLGDCLQRMKEIPEGYADMVMCDLPYGTTACKWDTVIPFEPLWEQYNRICKGAIVLTGAEPFASAMRLSNLTQFKYDWIWDKISVVGFANAKKQPLRNVETVSVFYKSQPVYNPQGVIKIEKRSRLNSSTHIEKHDGSAGITGLNGGQFKSKYYVQEFTNYPNQIISIVREGGFHPTQKPVALMEYLIRTYTNEGMIVLDNCMGSGTTGVACVNTGRNFIGIEMDENYFAIASKRIEEAKVK